MKIVLTGLPYFGKKLARELCDFDKKNTWVFCNTYYSRWDRVRFIFHLLAAKRVVSLNGVTSDSGSLNWVMRFKKKLILQWQGSDVLTAKKNKALGTFTRKYVDYAQSFTDAAWLKRELTDLGIKCELLHFKHLEVELTGKPFVTADAVSYVADGNEIFYGIGQVNVLAASFPHTKFHIIGSKGTGMTSPPNVIYHGWIDSSKVKELLNTNAIYIRLTEHDGYSLSVMEAIANGNYVIWNNPHAHATVIAEGSDPVPVFSALLAKVNKVGLVRNSEGTKWASESLDREKVLGEYVKTILKA